MAKNLSSPTIQIHYTSEKFPRGVLSGFANPLEVEVEELLWAAITVGRANLNDVLAHGRYSEFELIYRISMVLANLRIGGGNRLVRSPAFMHLDPSEKGAVSYFLGLTMAKLFSEKLLNVPWLLHLDVYRDQLDVNGSLISRQKPDLIGLSSARQWIIVESKGRANGLTRNLLQNGKQQTRMIRSIDKKRPYLRISAATYFSRNELEFAWKDPDDEAKDAINIVTKTEDYLRNYYRLIFTILTAHEAKDNNGFMAYTFPNLGITIGLQTQIYRAYQNQGLVFLEEFNLNSAQRLPAVDNQLFYVGHDGVAIGISPAIKRQLHGR
jgi:hypothetical protein